MAEAVVICQVRLFTFYTELTLKLYCCSAGAGGIGLRAGSINDGSISIENTEEVNLSEGEYAGRYAPTFIDQLLLIKRRLNLIKAKMEDILLIMRYPSFS